MSEWKTYGEVEIYNERGERIYNAKAEAQTKEISRKLALALAAPKEGE